VPAEPDSSGQEGSQGQSQRGGAQGKRVARKPRKNPQKRAEVLYGGSNAHLAREVEAFVIEKLKDPQQKMPGIPATVVTQFIRRGLSPEHFEFIKSVGGFRRFYILSDSLFLKESIVFPHVSISKQLQMEKELLASASKKPFSPLQKVQPGEAEDVKIVHMLLEETDRISYRKAEKLLKWKESHSEPLTSFVRRHSDKFRLRSGFLSLRAGSKKQKKVANNGPLPQKKRASSFSSSSPPTSPSFGAVKSITGRTDVVVSVDGVKHCLDKDLVQVFMTYSGYGMTRCERNTSVLVFLKEAAKAERMVKQVHCIGGHPVTATLVAVDENEKPEIQLDSLRAKIAKEKLLEGKKLSKTVTQDKAAVGGQKINVPLPTAYRSSEETVEREKFPSKREEAVFVKHRAAGFSLLKRNSASSSSGGNRSDQVVRELPDEVKAIFNDRKDLQDSDPAVVEEEGEQEMDGEEEEKEGVSEDIAHYEHDLPHIESPPESPQQDPVPTIRKSWAEQVSQPSVGMVNLSKGSGSGAPLTMMSLGGQRKTQGGMSPQKSPLMPTSFPSPTTAEAVHEVATKPFPSLQSVALADPKKL